MNPGISTARLMTLCAVWTAPLSLAWGLAQGWIAREVMQGGRNYTPVLRYPLSLGIAFAIALVQASLFARHRSPLRRWVPASCAGALLGMFLATLAAAQAGRMAMMGGLKESGYVLQTLAWSSTYGVCAGAVQGLALRRARKTLAWGFWLSGIVLLRAVPALALGVFHLSRQMPLRVEPLAIYAASSLFHGAVLAAGTAWLLDRLVFRAPDVEPAC